jgi:hypothetical protein
VRRRRILLLAILVYITLDLSLPTMPGAFVFEPADCVETVQTKGGRAGIERVAALPLATGPFVLPFLRTELADGLVLSREVTFVARPAVDHLPRGTIEPPPPTEDPH